MTSRDLLWLMLRRWYVMLLGAALSVGILYVATHQQAVYWTQFNVVLIGPHDPDRPNYLENSRFTLYPMVGVVANDVNAGHPPMMVASTDANMVGQGTRLGSQVRAPNLGSQWRTDFSASHLDVQVADSTPEAVSLRADQVVSEVSAALVTRQDELGIAPGMRVTSIASTADPTIYVVGGNRMRAAAGAALSGGAATIVLVYWLEKWRDRRRRRTAI